MHKKGVSMAPYQRNTFFLEEINSLQKTDEKLLIAISEEMYRQQINEITEELLSKKKIKIILIAGPSSSGKTTTSKLLAQSLHKQGLNSVTVSLDDFFLNRENTPVLPDGKYDFENITALDLQYLNLFIDNLFDNNTAKMPVFDFIKGKRKTEFVDIIIDDSTYVIIEGLHALNPSLITKHEDSLYKIYICVDSDFYMDNKIAIPAQDLRKMRRMIRDYYNRGRGVEVTADTWQQVLAGEQIFIKPFKKCANYVVDSTHMYEPLMYAKHLMPLLEKCDKTELTKLKNMLSYCDKMDKSKLPKDSLLHEFLT